jgi:hypothetical protein
LGIKESPEEKKMPLMRRIHEQKECTAIPATQKVA